MEIRWIESTKNYPNFHRNNALTYFPDSEENPGLTLYTRKHTFVVSYEVRHMKSLFTITLFSILLSGTIFPGAFIDFFQGRSDGTNVILEWKTRSETGMRSFEIQRKSGFHGEFTDIASMEPKGSNSFYSFEDRTAYKASESIYIYRVRIVETNGGPPSFTSEVTVSHNVSSVKRTWGSIKAMFR